MFRVSARAQSGADRVVPVPQIMKFIVESCRLRDAREQIVVLLENPGHYFLSTLSDGPPFAVFTCQSTEASGRISQIFLCEVDTDTVLGQGCMPVVVQRQFWSRQCRKLFGGPQLSLDMVLFVPSLLVGVQYIVKTCSATAPGCVGRIAQNFLREGELGS